jgi:hypothetical protein
VNAQNAQINMTNDTLEAARLVAEAMRATQSRTADHDCPLLPEADPDHL